MIVLFGLVLLVLGVVGIMIPAQRALWFRQYLRDWPAARRSLIASGAWIAFSRRFGLPYAALAVAAAVAWMVIAERVIPDTDAGASMLFGPCFALVVLAVILVVLRILRWTVDEG